MPAFVIFFTVQCDGFGIKRSFEKVSKDMAAVILTS